MNRTELTTLARKLMNQHGLHIWSFGFTNKKSAVATCYPGLRRIEFSAPYADVLGDWDIEQTILHEIAHALVPKTVRETDHGPEWKRIARSIGCQDGASLRREANRPEGIYVGVCPKGHLAYRDRATRAVKNADFSCGICDGSRFNEKSRITWYRTAEWKRGNAIPISVYHAPPVATPPRPAVVNVQAAYEAHVAQSHEKIAALRKPAQASPSRAREYDEGSPTINWD